MESVDIKDLKSFDPKRIVRVRVPSGPQTDSSAIREGTHQKKAVPKML